MTVTLENQLSYIRSLSATTDSQEDAALHAAIAKTLDKLVALRNEMLGGKTNEDRAANQMLSILQIQAPEASRPARRHFHAPR